MNPIAAHLARRAHLIALAIFAIVGIAILEDYGTATDEGAQRRIGNASFNYILGDADALPENVNRYYGAAFEVPLIAVERLFRLETHRAVHLSRRAIAHAFFLIGGFFAWLLAYRLFGSRLIALFAMLLFLLHPRLYAHSFFNTKDLPFLSMFMVALYLTHRAFRRDSLRAFVLCGVSAGLLANIRIVGVFLPPIVLGALAMDAVAAMRRGGGGGEKRALANAAAFFGAFAVVLYAARPLLWRNPAELVDIFRLMSQHTTIPQTLFRGEIVQYPNVPWDFVPTWILITAPPAALILAALGIAAVARLCAAHWRGMLANTTARFGLLTIAFLIIPVAAVIALNSNLYNDWRHMYFLWAPICVLAAFGMNLIMDAAKTPPLRAAACALIALGIALTAVQIVRLHPYQQEYFNPLAAKDSLADRWQMNYWGVVYKEALDELLKMRPSGRIAVMSIDDKRLSMLTDMRLLTEEERSRFLVSPKFPSFRIVEGDGGGAPVFWRREVYGVPLVSIVDERAESDAFARATYAAAKASAPNASGGGFDVYADDKTLIYIKEDCAEEDPRARFWLSIFPENPEDLPPERRAAGFEHDALNFDFSKRDPAFAAFDGKCLLIRDMPHYPARHVETGKFAPAGEKSALRSGEIILPDYYKRRLRQAESSGEPALRSDFDVYLEGDSLLYIRKDCAAANARGRFFLSVFPQNPADLPPNRRAAGFDHDSLNFAFPEHGAILDGDCVIIRDLPDYPISRMETGQWIPNEGELWRGEIALGE